MKLFSTYCETLPLGWDQPLLPRAATTLRERFAGEVDWDLEQVICVLPGRHAVGRLKTLLSDEARRHGMKLKLPTIITVGQLPEMLYRPDAPIALELEQTLAWASVLRGCQPDRLKPLLPSVPAAEPIGPWLELASTLRRLQEDLASSGLSFSDVVEVAESESESRRWKLMDQLFQQYLDAIGKAGLVDPHWARRRAVIGEKCRCEKTLVLIGTSDLSESLISMLRGLESDVISLVAAPLGEMSRFDQFGCVDTQAWIEHELPLSDEQLLPAGDVSDSATAVAESLAGFATRWSADQVVVGVTDTSQVGPLELELRGCGVGTHRHLGWTVSETSVGRLFGLTAAYLQRRTWQSLAALVRHADVYHFVSQSLAEPNASSAPSESLVVPKPAEGNGDQDWLTDLDRLLADHYPIRLSDALPAKALSERKLAVAVGQLVERWLSPFSAADQSIGQWSGVILDWLDQLCMTEDQRSDDTGSANQAITAAGSPDRPASRSTLARQATRRLLQRFAELNGHLDLRVAGVAALEAISARLADLRVVPEGKDDDVEVLGWLDLALHDAPAMVVMGLNHPFVPGSVTSDPFLPGTLRTRLRMDDHGRRYARDVYAMQVMLASRPETRFVVGKTGADGSPTPPSRLLAAAAPVDVARRTRYLLSDHRPAVNVEHRWDQGDADGLPIPRLTQSSSSTSADAGAVDDGQLVSSMSVTAFRDYLTCPYRFYLRHVLKLKPLDDAASELAANQFGDLVHAAVERFGESDDRDESDCAKIESLLLEHLDAYVDEMYGDSVSTAVNVQSAQARRRLKVVAQRQAERIAAGWRIHATEASVGPAEGSGVDVDGKRMGLKGRFDRIDRHSDGHWAILDYKTHGHRPEKKHLQRTDDGEKWIDLQLPLYRMMIPFLGIDVPPAEVQLGYFNVAEKDTDTKINVAEFTESQMQDAEALVHDCIRRIRRHDFSPTEDRVQFDDYAMILQTGVASRLLDQADSIAEGGPV